MKDVVYLAVAYLRAHPGRTGLLVFCLALNIYLPLAARWWVGEFTRMGLGRASATPLILGAKGSALGLGVHALFFHGEVTETLRWGEVEALRATGLGEFVPLLVRFRARGFPVVGTTPDYRRWRGLGLTRGAWSDALGETVLGARVAERLGLEVGETVRTDPENAFDLTGPTAWTLRVAGILAPAGTADDDAVFVSMSTGWLLMGQGHAHDPVETNSAATASGRPERHLHPASRVYQNPVDTVTAQNRAAFHFHGEMRDFPVTALLAFPRDAKAEVLLLGRALEPERKMQVIQPREVLGDFIRGVSKTRELFALGGRGFAVVSGLLILLIGRLGWRLREGEWRTLDRLGCSRRRVILLHSVEWILVFALGLLLALALLGMTQAWAPSLWRWWLRGAE